MYIRTTETNKDRNDSVVDSDETRVIGDRVCVCEYPGVCRLVDADRRGWEAAGQVYIDLSSVRQEKSSPRQVDAATVRMLQDWKEPQKQVAGAHSIKTVLHFDCVDERFQMGHVCVHAGHMMTGKVLGSDDSDGAWELVDDRPAHPIRKAMTVACGKGLGAIGSLLGLGLGQ